MKKAVIITISILAALLLIGLIIIGWIVGLYNGFVTLEENADTAWANVETSYERRLALIPNLVATVQGAADFESDTQSEIAELRSQAISAQTQFNNAQDVAGQQAAAGQSEGVLSRFFAVMEAYPDLKATQNFADLQAQLEGTENRINVALDRYNEAVRAYNTRIRQFPGAFFAGVFGFERKDLFEAQEGAEVAPVVEFN